MFVSAGAKEKILKKRRSAFYDSYVKELINEAKSLGISKTELINMIKETKE
jgi:DNA-binding transcriptional regulator YhcF (GntR family)